MTYQVLARKWRPQTFASLVGQQTIVTALQNALAEGKIAQAYLFSGIRGVGKTTAARLLAKALNCETGPTAEPCNRCTICRDITLGSDMDVIEVDAATYSKVEQVRELTESLRYGPARDRYKVVVLDEIHRLSRQAFDALLKIVEEPPAHLVFVFATTEIEAVPATLLSRCQEFHFRRVPASVLAGHLRAICEREGITASDTALRLIARAGEGSVRDSVALLDQLGAFGAGEIADEDAVRLLGGLDTALFHQLLAAILDGRSSEVRDAVERIEAEGWDPRHVYAQFLAYARDALHLALGGEPGGVDLPEEEARALATLSRGAGYENLLRLLNQLLLSESSVRRSETGALALEIAWLRAAELPKLTAVEALLAGAPATANASRPPRSGASRLAGGPSPMLGVRTGSTPSEAPPPAAAASPPTASEEHLPTDPRRHFLEEVSRRKQPLAAHLEAAQKLEFADGRLAIHLPPGDPWLTRALQRQSNRTVLDQAVRNSWGEAARWELVETEISAPRPAAAEAPTTEAAEDPAVQAVLDLFGGRVETVEEHENVRED